VAADLSSSRKELTLKKLTWKTLARIVATKRADLATDLAGKSPQEVLRETEEVLRAFAIATNEANDPDLLVMNAYHDLDPEDRSSA
jgi:hypothetical protein